MDRQRLHTRVCRAAADRRRPRRPLRPATHLPCRNDAVHGRIGRRGARTEHGHADRGARDPGRRAAIATPLTLTLLAEAFPAERRGARSVSGRRSAAWRLRSDRSGRRSHHGPRLALDLLDQRADRRGAASVRRAGTGRELRAVRNARPTGLALDRAGCSVSSTASCTPRARVSARPA